MKKGEIILVPFPYTDLSGVKNRPAMVLFEEKLDVTLCFISTQLKWKEGLDVVLFPSEKNGLKKESLLRLTKIVTIDKNLILGKLGELDFDTIEQVNSNLIQLLDL